MTTPHTPLAPASSSLCGTADSLRHTLSDAVDSAKSAEQRWTHRADQLGDQL